MTTKADLHPMYEPAVAAINEGDLDTLGALLAQHPDLTTARDEGNGTLLMSVVDWPGHRPHGAESARLLLEAGAEVDARRADDQGTPLSGTACTNEIDTMRVLLDFGADVHAPCGFCPGSVLDFVKRLAENIAHRHEFREMADLFARHAQCEVPDRAAMGRAAPVLYVSDMRRATDFYVNRLGFLCTYAQGDPASPIYAIVERGSAEIHLNAYKPEGRAGRCSCHVLADPIDELFAEYEAAGIVFEQELNVQEWGLKDFVLRDPDGNRLEIGGPIRNGEQG